MWVPSGPNKQGGKEQKEQLVGQGLTGNFSKGPVSAGHERHPGVYGQFGSQFLHQ